MLCGISRHCGGIRVIFLKRGKYEKCKTIKKSDEHAVVIVSM